MIIPSSHDAVSGAVPTPAFALPFMPILAGDSDGSTGEDNWSSLIGIITAIVGNVLISFALNIQRYAHIRLERELQEKERSRKDRLRRAGHESQGYGTQQEIANERETANSKSQSKSSDTEYRLSEDSDLDNAVDTDPLIPTLSRPGRSSTDTHSTSASTIKDLAEAEYKQRSYLHSPYWWTGIILMTTGEAGNFLAYGFAPASIVSPLGVVALVSNCIVAPVMFKESFRKRDFLGVIIAVAGAVTVVLSANEDNPKLGPDVIWDLITTWEFETYLGITTASAITLMLASRKYGSKSILIDLGLVGLFGGYTALATKGVASLLSYTLWHLLTFPITYLLLFVLIFTAVMQIKYVNRALQRFDATQVIPTQFVLFTLSVILGSAVLYRDFERTNADHAGKFIGGCAMTFLGVWFITSKRPRRSDEEDREPEPIDAINLVDGERYRDSVDHGDAVSRAARSSSPPIPISTSPRQMSHDSLPQTPNLAVTPQEQTVETPTAAFPTISHSLTNNPWDSESPSHNPLSYFPPPERPPSTPLPNLVNGSNNPASLSAPELPSVYQDIAGSGIRRPQTPRGVSDLAVNTQLTRQPPQTPQAQTDQLLIERPVSRGERDRPRHSIAGTTPLFMTSPLSSSLSAVVAELRRGSTSARNQGSPLRPAGVRRDTTDGDASNASLDRTRSNTDNATTPGADDAQDPNKTVRRGRSVSGTLTDIFRWMGDGSVEPARDEEQGRERR